MARLDLAGAGALVTGAARGIGWETALALHARGASVCLVDLDPDAVADAAARIGDRAYGAGADVTDAGDLQTIASDAAERFGRLDVIVANAGIAARPRPITALGDEEFDRVLAVDLDGVINTVRAGMPHVIEARGHIVVIASVYAFVNGALQSPYAMAKAAVEQFGRSLRIELAPLGVSAGVGYFGFVDTKMVADALDDQLGDRLLDASPSFLHKKITPEQAGRALVDGIERRAPRTIRPKRWIAYSVLRGVVNPLLDRIMVSRAEVQDLIRDADRAG